MPLHKDEIIMDGPLLWKLARKSVEVLSTRFHDNGAEVLGVQLHRDGTIFKVDAKAFKAARAKVKEELNGNQD